MNLIDTALSPLRKALSAAERETETVFPVRDLEDIQERALGAVEAIKQATESIESHVEALDGLAEAVPPLTEAVRELTAQLTVLAAGLTPVLEVEHEMSRFGHLFRREHGEPRS